MPEKYQHRELTTLKKHPRNPRFIKDRQFKTLVKSIEDNADYFEARPIILSDRTDELIIIAGNMRFEAAKEIGLKKVPTFLLSGLSEEREKEIMIRDNVSNGEWDFDILSADYDAEQLIEWGMDLPEFLDMPEETEAQEDNYEIPEKVQTTIQPGDLFEIGPHRLICGDATSKEDALKLFAGRHADLIITDPPYNVDYTGNTKDALKIKNDKKSDGAFFEFLFDFYANIAKFTKPGGAWYVWHADSEGMNFRKAFIEAGLELKQCLIWVKNSMVMGRQDYQWRHEPCLYGWKPGAAHYFIDDRTQTTVIDDKINIAKLTKDEMKALLKEIFSTKTATSVIYHDRPTRSDIHPTMKPVTLMGYLMKNSSKRLELVADPFLGSGSTMVAAHQLSRRCFGLELDPVYCEVIVDRMLSLDPALHVLKNGQPYQHIHLERTKA